MSEEKKDEILEKEKELDEGELETVAGGGGVCGCFVFGGGTEDGTPCGCILGGGGKKGFNGSVCACVAYGEGDTIDDN